MTTEKKFPASEKHKRKEDIYSQLTKEPDINPDAIRLVDEKLMGDDKDISVALGTEDSQKEDAQDYSSAENNRTDIEED